MTYRVIFPVCSQTFPILHAHVTPYYGWILISFIRPLLKDTRVISRFSPLRKYPALDLWVPDFVHTSVQGRVLAEGRCLEVEVFGQRATEFWTLMYAANLAPKLNTFFIPNIRKVCLFPCLHQMLSVFRISADQRGRKSHGFNLHFLKKLAPLHSSINQLCFFWVVCSYSYKPPLAFLKSGYPFSFICGFFSISTVTFIC